ncbi:DUF5988 family protein [Nonomuraea soli]|uniref:Uncharacterized protein n=1 Tax=Nonomuraea soli TaxID=1032476 RepID=A0A7W0CML2_9ACTN|nr:DUF5988 family protein [Nonomuraea soli]MBA2893777.1 hypothetical protein [Nonomuraea soli]
MAPVPSPATTAIADCANWENGPYDVNIFLLGGPSDFPEGARYRRLDNLDEKVKIQHRSGYEHFERSDEHYHVGGDCQGVVYRWTTRTRIAE